jgi:8-amino-7-oxononanoate synthase
MDDRGFDLDDRVAARRERDLYRELAPADAVGERAYFAPPPGGDLPVLDSEQRLVFASNNYLGLTLDERVQAAAREAADVVGTGAGASRLVTGDTMVHHDLERQLAEVKGTDRALAFSSGYAANVGVLGALAPDVVFSDELNHASIVDGCRLSGADVVVYDHRDAADLWHRMRERADRADAEESWLIVTDTVFSMDGDVAPLPAICSAAEEFGAWVMVDEAHATGLYSDGGGVVQAEGCENRINVQMGTLSKALASQGGYVAGNEALIELLVNEARSFVYSTGLSPASAAAATEALHISRHDDVREALWSNVRRLRNGLEDLGYDVLGETQILPILVGDRVDAMALSAGVRERGIVAPAIRPPTVPEGESRVRVSPMATHSEGDIDHCLDAFAAAGEEVGLL